MKKIISILIVCMLAIFAFGCNKEEGDKVTKRVMHNYPMYNGVELPLELWMKPESKESPENDRSSDDGNIKGIYIRSDYDGQESYAFAFLGLPSDTSKKCPAVLLIHGGGGTAYWQWVKEWNDRGYVALAVDMEGHVPLASGTYNDGPTTLYTNSTYTTPKNQNYADADLKTIDKTWMYYAVSTAITANSYLHSLDYVDKQNIGVCGISWGGVITSIITGYDDRFAFSIPIYCTLNLYGCKSDLSSYYNNHANARVWDDDLGIKQVDTPILFLASDKDKCSSPLSVSKTADGCKNARISLVKGLLHSHGHAIMQNEPFEFADEIVKGTKRMVKVLNNPNSLTGTINFEAPQGETIKAYLMTTKDDNPSSASTWDFTRLTVNGNSVDYTVNSTEKFFYIYFETSTGLVTSTTLYSNL